MPDQVPEPAPAAPAEPAPAAPAGRSLCPVCLTGNVLVRRAPSGTLRLARHPHPGTGMSCATGTGWAV